MLLVQAKKTDSSWNRVGKIGVSGVERARSRGNKPSRINFLKNG